MTDIDLTEATTNAAREARARFLTRQEHPAITTLDAMDTLNGHRADWDGITLTEQNLWREEVVGLVHAAHQDVARQAWEQGRHAGAEDGADFMLGTGTGTTANPYAEARP